MTIEQTLSTAFMLVWLAYCLVHFRKYHRLRGNLARLCYGIARHALAIKADMDGRVIVAGPVGVEPRFECGASLMARTYDGVYTIHVSPDGPVEVAWEEAGDYSPKEEAHVWGD